MKETISLLLVSLAVLMVSNSSFKNISKQNFLVSEEKSISQTTETNKESSKQDKKTGKGEAKETPQEENTQAEVSESASSSEASAPAEQTPASTPAPSPAPAPAPAQSVNNSGANMASLTTAAARLNAAPLNPSYTPYAELNNIINQILSSQTNSSMSTYQKVKACYMYIINTCSEGKITGSYSYKTGGWNMYAQALALFCEHRGMCDCYSAGFCVLARAIGLNCSQVEGDIPGFPDHDWCQVNINGTVYIFDVDVEEDTSYSGREHYFCKTYGELSEYYYKKTIG